MIPGEADKRAAVRCSRLFGLVVPWSENRSRPRQRGPPSPSPATGLAGTAPSRQRWQTVPPGLPPRSRAARWGCPSHSTPLPRGGATPPEPQPSGPALWLEWLARRTTHSAQGSCERRASPVGRRRAAHPCRSLLLRNLLHHDCRDQTLGSLDAPGPGSLRVPPCRAGTHGCADSACRASRWHAVRPRHWPACPSRLPRSDPRQSRCVRRLPSRTSGALPQSAGWQFSSSTAKRPPRADVLGPTIIFRASIPYRRARGCGGSA
jgi:hypothetical protein